MEKENAKILGKLWKTWLDTRKGGRRCEGNWHNFVTEDCFDLTKNLKDELGNSIVDDAFMWYLSHTKTVFS